LIRREAAAASKRKAEEDRIRELNKKKEKELSWPE
jgi:hypothetical protein